MNQALVFKQIPNGKDISQKVVKRVADSANNKILLQCNLKNAQMRKFLTLGAINGANLHFLNKHFQTQVCFLII